MAAAAETVACVRDGWYPCPASYGRADREFAYVGFYRFAPVSAVTHYAPVEGRFRDDGSWMGSETFERLVGSRSDDLEAVVFELGALVELDTPVRNDFERGALRGAWYVPLSRLERARASPG